METARNFTITSWPMDPKDSPLVIAVPGVKFSGWWPDALPEAGLLNNLIPIWRVGAAEVKIERDILEDPDGIKHQVCAYVRIRQHPERWLGLIGESLKCFSDQGAAISWCGGWECFLQYSPMEAFAGCYAAYTVATGLICFGDIDEPIRYLDQVPGVARRLHDGAALAARTDGKPRST